MDKKMCSSCKRVLNRNEFYKNRARPDGFDPHCKACRRDYTRALREAKRLKHESGELKMWSEKRCGGCGEVKPADQFPKSVYTTSGLASYCRKCSTKCVLAWREKKKANGRA